MPDVPVHLMSVRYDGARYPGAADAADSADLTEGANCQLFACALLPHFGLTVPPLRSSELWGTRAIPGGSPSSSGTAPRTRGART